MTILNRYIGVIPAIALASCFWMIAQAKPGEQQTPQTETGRSETQTSEPNQTRALSWGSHESIKSCISCHVNAMDALSEPDDAKLKAPVPQLCTGCHTTFSDLDGWVHGPVATGQCLICHGPHQTATASLLKKAPPDLCHQCHEPASLNLIERHGDLAYAECQTCHAAHAGAERMLLRPEFVKARELLALINPKTSSQSRFVGQPESLQGIDSIQVAAVIDRARQFEAYGLTALKLNRLVEQLLEKHGITVLSQDTRTKRTGLLEVHLRLVEVPSPQSGQIAAVSGSLNVKLRQTVELPNLPGDDTHRTCLATTWDAGGLVVWGTRQCEAGLKQATDVFMTQFGIAYKKANAPE